MLNINRAKDYDSYVFYKYFHILFLVCSYFFSYYVFRRFVALFCKVEPNANLEDIYPNKVELLTSLYQKLELSSKNDVWSLFPEV